MTSKCPRCENSRDTRDGPYFVCTDCRWCWTVSITGTVYVQAEWPHRSGLAEGRVARLLRSIDGLTERLSSPAWPAPPAVEALARAGFAPREIERLERARAATEADFFNEGVPLARLRAEGVSLPADPD